MKNYISVVILALSMVAQNAFSSDSSSTTKKVLGSILIAGGVGAFIYEAGKDVETDDSSQTKLLSAASIVGGIVLFRSASKNATVQIGSHQSAAVLGIRYEI